jgi:predicted Abi (CAAX) family protease
MTNICSIDIDMDMIFMQVSFISRSYGSLVFTPDPRMWRLVGYGNMLHRQPICLLGYTAGCEMHFPGKEERGQKLLSM